MTPLFGHESWTHSLVFIRADDLAAPVSLDIDWLSKEHGVTPVVGFLRNGHLRPKVYIPVLPVLLREVQLTEKGGNSRCCIRCGR